MARELAPAFVWGQGGARKTPEQIARDREVAAALAQRGADFSPAGHWSVALGRGLQGVLGGLEDRQANAAELTNQGANSGYIAQLLAGVPGAGGAPAVAAAPAAVGGAAPSPSMAGTVAPPVTAPNNSASVAPEISSGIVATANSLGIDPVDLATVISYETGGTFNPTQAGPTTQWGQHRGLIQFGEAQAKENGVDWNNPVGSQLGEQGAIANYLRRAGVKPGMGIMDVYSAINAGGIGRYNASDANNGGAPGTVADKVNQQMAGHRAKAQALLGQGAPAGVQVASTDPSAGVAQALAMQPSDVSGANALAVPAPVTGAAPQRVAQAPMPMPMQQQPQQPSINPAILKALSDPYASREVKGVAQALLGQQAEQAQWMARQQYEQQQVANDPLRQLQIQQLQQKVDQGPTADESYFGNPIAVQNPDGSIAYGQIGNRGSFKPIQLGGGQQFAPPTRTVSTETETLLMDQAGNVISRTPINNRQAAADKAGGAVEGQMAAENAAQAPKDVQTGQNALALLDQIENHPGLDVGTGATSFGNQIRGTKGYDFQNLVDQAKSGAFLTAVEQLRGLGSMSNAEGGAATAAITRMDTATSKEGFLSALSDYRKIINQSIERSRGRMKPVAGGAAATLTPGSQPAGAPAPGTVKGGYRFKGGNPADKSSWEPI